MAKLTEVPITLEFIISRELNTLARMGKINKVLGGVTVVEAEGKGKFI